MQPSRPSIWLPESNRIASGKPGTLHSSHRRFRKTLDFRACQGMTFDINLSNRSKVTEPFDSCRPTRAVPRPVPERLLLPRLAIHTHN